MGGISITGHDGFYGSNVDIPQAYELDAELRQLSQDYDNALALWFQGDSEWREAAIEYEDAYAEEYQNRRVLSEKVTLVKKDTEMTRKVREANAKMLKAEGVKELGERTIRKIEAQRSAAQSRVKMLLSQQDIEKLAGD